MVVSNNFFTVIYAESSYANVKKNTVTYSDPSETDQLWSQNRGNEHTQLVWPVNTCL